MALEEDFVYANARTSDSTFDVTFDAALWLKVADPEDVLMLAEEGFTDCGPAMAALYTAQDSGDEKIQRFFENYRVLSATQRHHVTICVFIEPEDVARYLLKYRPEVFEFVGSDLFSD